MSTSTPRLPSIVRQLKGEENRLTHILIQLGSDKNDHADVWRALVERAVVCLRWAQDAIRSAAETVEPRPALPARAAGAAAESGLGGRSTVVPVHTALELLTGLGKSGTLRVDCGSECFEVLLDGGAVIYARGMQPSPGERLGEILVRQGVMTQESLEEAVQRAQLKGERIGTLLLHEGLVTAQQLSAALAEQACAIFSRLNAVGDARWSFEERAPALRA